jgi:hypothetical protein
LAWASLPIVVLARPYPLRERDVTGPVFRTYNAECFTTRYSIMSAFQLPYKTFRPHHQSSGRVEPTPPPLLTGAQL